MEHYFRTALWMIFLAGCFQAAPTYNSKIEKYEINFGRLRKIVKFEGNVTFKFPKDVSDSCLGEAVHTIIKGLEHAKLHAKSGKTQCDRAIEVLEYVDITSPHNDSSECKTQEERSLNFEDFLNKFEEIVDRINSAPKSTDVL